MKIIIFEDSMYLCLEVKQYYFGENPMFTYTNHIRIKRKVSRDEANFIYSVITTNSNLCAGKALEIIELTYEEKKQ